MLNASADHGGGGARIAGTRPVHGDLGDRFVTIAATVLSGVVAGVLGPRFHVQIAGFTLHRYDTIYLVCGITVLAAGLYARLALPTRAQRVPAATTDDHVVAGAGP